MLSMAHSTKGYSFAEKVGGSSNKGYCDYYWTSTGGSTWSAVGWYGALLSAYAVDGAAAGFGCLGANNRSSDAGAYVGFRFYRGFNL